MEKRDYRSTQVANIASPAVGFILSIPGLFALTLRALSNRDGVHILTFIIFGSSLVISYALFTLYRVGARSRTKLSHCNRDKEMSK